MSTLSVLAILMCLASVFGFINYRLLRLPASIGLMVVAMLASLCVLGFDLAFPAENLRGWSKALLGTMNLPDTLLNGALSFLLFAGALRVDIAALWSRKVTVFLLATIGVALATALFGCGIWACFRLTSLAVPLPWCLVLGAILSPTDPIAIAGMLDRVGLPAKLRAVMAGESLFNDGVGVVAFTATLTVATAADDPSLGAVGLDFLRETGGGLVLGGACGWGAYHMMCRIDDYPLEIMISLALASGAYVLANAIGVSGPIAVVVSGLLIGNRGTRLAMSNTTRQNLTLFWSVIDELLNAGLFLLLGFEVLSLELNQPVALAAGLAIPLALVVRAASIVVPVYWLHAGNPNRWPGIAILTWGGLRGGISVALALSVPHSEWRNALLLVCYAVVVFTIIVQGLTIQRVINLVGPRAVE